jgi:hypothetical protein
VSSLHKLPKTRFKVGDFVRFTKTKFVGMAAEVIATKGNKVQVYLDDPSYQVPHRDRYKKHWVKDSQLEYANYLEFRKWFGTCTTHTKFQQFEKEHDRLNSGYVTISETYFHTSGAEKRRMRQRANQRRRGKWG